MSDASSQMLKIKLNNKPTDISELKVAELKTELKKRGVSTSGNKQELYEKLKNYLIKQNQNSDILDTSQSPTKSPRKQPSSNNNDTPSISEAETARLLQEEALAAQLKQQAEEAEAKLLLEQQEAAEKERQRVAEQLAKEKEEEARVALELEKERLEALEKEETERAEVEARLAEQELKEKEQNDVKMAETEPANEQEAETVAKREPSRERSESCVNEVPMSGDRNRFSRSRSPKARWHQDNDEVVKQEEVEEGEAAKPLEAIETKVEEKETKPIEEPDDLPPSKTQRKRKWLSNDSQAASPLICAKKSLTISSDTLKSYLPTNPLIDLNKQTQEAPITTTVKIDVGDEKENILEPQNETFNQPEPFLKQQSSRTVILEEPTELDYEDTSMTEPVSSLVSQKDDDNQAQLPKSASHSPSHKPVSNVLHISNLTRPFTLNQLKELLAKHGTLLKLDESSTHHFFWINPVKSHCYVAYESEQDAKHAHAALHNLTWPASNPKQLQCEYSTMDQIQLHMNIDKPILITKQINNETHKQVSVTINGSVNPRDKENGPVKEKEKEKPMKQQTVREWDLPKLRASHRSRSRSREKKPSKSTEEDPKEKLIRKEKEKEKEKEVKPAEAVPEEPPKTLDDLFKKTNTTPFIYWLPMTEEKYLEKQKDFERRQVLREQRAEERRLKEQLEAEALKTAAKQVEEETAAKKSSVKPEEEETENDKDKEKRDQVRRERDEREREEREKERERYYERRDRYAKEQNRRRSPPAPSSRYDVERRGGGGYYGDRSRQPVAASSSGRRQRTRSKSRSRRSSSGSSTSRSRSRRSSRSSSSGSSRSSSSSSSSSSSRSRSRSRSGKEGKVAGKHARSRSGSSEKRKRARK